MLSLTPLIDFSYYHTTTEASLRLHYSPVNPSYSLIFTGYLPSEVVNELRDRVTETEMRSILIILARLDAAFNIDYRVRAKSNNADALSVAFRKIYSKRGEDARLDDDIFDTWKKHLDPSSKAVVSKLKGMMKYRHWLAHGRYWQFGNKHSYTDVYLLAEIVLTQFGLQS